MDPLYAIYRGRADKLLAELWIVHLVAGAAAGVVGALFTPLGWWAMPVALGGASGLAFFWLAVGERRLRSAMFRPNGASRDHLSATVCGPNDEPRLTNIVEGVCLMVGVDQPTLVVHPAETANAAVYGRRPGSTTVIVTRGLLEALDRIGLEAIIARLLTQVRDGRIAYLTTAVTTVGLPALLWRAMMPLVQVRLEREASTGSDFEHDTEAVRLTRYPPGLANALESMSQIGVSMSASQVTWPLWLADPRSDDVGQNRQHTGLPDYRADLETRVAVLREF